MIWPEVETWSWNSANPCSWNSANPWSWNSANPWSWNSANPWSWNSANPWRLISIFTVQARTNQRQGIKGRDRLSNIFEMKVQDCREKLRMHLIPIRHFYGVKFFNKIDLNVILSSIMLHSLSLRLFNKIAKLCRR